MNNYKHKVICKKIMRRKYNRNQLIDLELFNKLNSLSDMQI